MVTNGFSELFIKLLEQKGLTFAELGERSKVSSTALYKLAKGEVGDSKLTDLNLIAEALEVAPMDLLQPYFNQIEQQESPIEVGLNQVCDIVQDITYPQNAIVFTKQTFKKVWSIKNNTSSVWQGVQLHCIDDASFINGIPINLQPHEKLITLADTAPGEKAWFSVMFSAPILPCSTVSRWKLIDKDAKPLLAKHEKVQCAVKVLGL